MWVHGTDIGIRKVKTTATMGIYRLCKGLEYGEGKKYILGTGGYTFRRALSYVC